MDLERAKRALFARLAREVRDRRVIEAMSAVPRERFVPVSYQDQAYEDIPLPIAEGQTISQPYIVAMMTSALDLQPGDKVLEIGTGSGYQAAILARLARKVITVERFADLAEGARRSLQALGYTNAEVRLTGGALGCPQEAPFDAIIVTAGAPRLPRVLLDQLAVGGRMVIPVGGRYEQDLLKVVRTQEGYSVHSLGPCRFVPLVGRDAWEGDTPES